jgi:hypothetical protein
MLIYHFPVLWNILPQHEIILQGPKWRRGAFYAKDIFQKFPSSKELDATKRVGSAPKPEIGNRKTQSTNKTAAWLKGWCSCGAAVHQMTQWGREGEGMWQSKDVPR